MENNLYQSPLSIPLTKKKGFRLNLNNYRNLHYRLLNNAKVLYKDIMKEQIINHNNKYEKVVIVYTIYAPNKRGFDVGNVASIHQKFFEDALVELGGLTDDRYDYIPMCIYMFGGIDTANPRVDIEVINIDSRCVTKVHKIVDKNLEMWYNKSRK